MARFNEMSTGWKWFWAIMFLIVLAGAIFCLVAFIMSSSHNVSFGEEIYSWFCVVKDVVPDTSGTVNPTNLFLN